MCPALQMVEHSVSHLELLLGLGSHLHYAELAEWPWASDQSSLSLSFSICKMGIIVSAS